MLRSDVFFILCNRLIDLIGVLYFYLEISTSQRIVLAVSRASLVNILVKFQREEKKIPRKRKQKSGKWKRKRLIGTECWSNNLTK